MLEGQIPKDVRKYDAKFIGPFTLRQAIFFIISCVVGYVFYTVFKQFLDVQTSLAIAVILILPFLAFGWVKPYGMPLEKFLQSALISTVLSPHHRKYKTNNMFEAASVKITPMTKGEYKKRLKKEKKAHKNDKYTMFK